LGGLLGEERAGILQEKLNLFIRENFESHAPQAARYAASALDGAFPGLVRRFLQFLMKDEVHQRLEIQGRIFLDNAVQKLSAFQRFFVSAGQYDRTLRERMPELIDDLIGQIEAFLCGPDMRRRFSSFAEESFLTLASQKTSLEILSQIVSSLAMPYLTMPLGEAVKKLAAGDLRAVIIRVRELITRKDGAGFEQILRNAADRMLGEYGDAALSDFFLIDGSKKEQLDVYIGETLLKIADGRIEGILKSINIKALVSDRINSLDMTEVEHIVLDVMDSQLKWINVFGAILGFFIGGLQVLLSLITR
jgi:uncharacterized membrane protein YheB (UPF0754 family)